MSLLTVLLFYIMYSIIILPRILFDAKIKRNKLIIYIYRTHSFIFNERHVLFNHNIHAKLIRICSAFSSFISQYNKQWQLRSVAQHRARKHRASKHRASKHSASKHRASKRGIDTDTSTKTDVVQRPISLRALRSLFGLNTEEDKEEYKAINEKKKKNKYTTAPKKPSIWQVFEPIIKPSSTQSL